MPVVDANRIQPQRFSAHRPGMSENRRLLQGPQGPGSFEFSIVHSDDGYATPRHRHNFDQIRFMLKGRFGFGDSVQEEGSVGYFTEGVHYQQQAIGASDTLLLQFGGASGEGFMQYPQLERGHAELGERGEFHDGVFTWYDAAGKKHNQDAYEAIWEHVNARSIRYPQPRYQQPIIMDPASYAWTETGGGVKRKTLGRFTERSIDIAFTRMAAGARQRWVGPRLIHVLQGQGGLDPGGAPPQHAHAGITAYIEDGETLDCRAENALVCFEIGLPHFPMPEGSSP